MLSHHSNSYICVSSAVNSYDVHFCGVVVILRAYCAATVVATVSYQLAAQFLTCIQVVSWISTRLCYCQLHHSSACTRCLYT